MKSERYLPSQTLVLKCKELDNELTPTGTACLVKLVVARLLKKFLAFRLIIVFKKATDGVLSQCTYSHLFLIRSTLILFFLTHTRVYIYTILQQQTARTLEAEWRKVLRGSVSTGAKED
jgi:hypothetical protein